MKQVRHYLRNGALDIGDVPMPAIGPGDVLVRSHYSFVSVGTEKMKVSQARMSLVEKAKERPDQVKLVLNTLREQGLIPTLRKVQERLNTRPRIGCSDEISRRLEALRRWNDEDEGSGAERNDCRKISQWVIALGGIERRRNGVGGRSGEKRVAVGFGLGDETGCNGPSGAGTVVHDKTLAELR